MLVRVIDSLRMFAELFKMDSKIEQYSAKNSNEHFLNPIPEIFRMIS